ncbi:tetratricopeptide repeat protein [Mucilaginibacter sp. MD40]|uniref:tetratricopeptide repeat protein n=1 Tax=Mucilaginibacter sp. MD40 TaxID=2029590 RepID=UPI00117CE72D|nr:tetratricopeptide repeat protein [Mucilaginibacter sp. MD40]
MTTKRLHILRFGLFSMPFLWLMLGMPTLNAVQGAERPAYKPFLFTNLKDTAADRRVEAARALSRPCRKMTEADAMRTIDDLGKIAADLNDLALQCAVFDLRADYYSVNRGYNQLSTQYYKKAVELAEERKDQMLTGIYQHRIANYFALYKKNIEAAQYYLLSERNLKETGYKKVPGIGNIFSETSNFYYALGDYDGAREYLKNALIYQTAPSRTRINIFNTIGLTYRNTNNYQLALNYFHEALKLAGQLHDTIWIALAKGNIGSVYVLQKRYKEALPLVREDYVQSVKYNEGANCAIAMLRLAQISLSFNDVKLASAQLDTANQVLSTTKENVLKERIQYYELLAQVKEKSNKPTLAEHYLLLSEQLKDSLMERDNVAAIDRVRLKWTKEKSLEDYNNLQIKTRINSYKQYTVITVLLLLMVIGVLIFNRQRLKTRKDKEILAAELRRLDEERKSAENALSDYTENLKQKNDIIEGFKTELERLQYAINDRTLTENLDRMMHAHIMTDDKWDEFRKLFTKVHGNFLFNIRQRYPAISATDMRLMALIKLKLNNREMAGMLCITVDGVKKAKQRLRKKLNLADNEEIEDVVNTL